MTAPVERYFDRHAAAYDRRYDRERLQRLVRPSLVRGRDYVLSLSRALGPVRVLEVGCGPARAGERVLAAGAREYVGVDLSAAMVARARRRLQRFGSRATVVHADFAEAKIDGRFELVFALGVFDYLGEPERFLGRMAEKGSGILVATFPRWVRTRDPLRTLVYRRLYGCRLEHYDDERLAALLERVGLPGADVVSSRSGFRVTAHVRERTRSRSI